MSLSFLIEQARAGDPRARRQLAELLDERIRRTAGRYARLTGMDREDLQQEMRLGMLLGLEALEPGIGDPLHYLFLRGKWRLLEAVRRSSRQRAESLEADPALVEPTALEEEVHARWLARRLHGRLPALQRLILEGLLRGERQDELARRLGCTPANISYHVRRIREGYRALAADRRDPPRAGSRRLGPRRPSRLE